jgi:hypothetical protein
VRSIICVPAAAVHAALGELAVLNPAGSSSRWDVTLELFRNEYRFASFASTAAVADMR